MEVLNVIPREFRRLPRRFQSMVLCGHAVRCRPTIPVLPCSYPDRVSPEEFILLVSWLLHGVQSPRSSLAALCRVCWVGSWLACVACAWLGS